MNIQEKLLTINPYSRSGEKQGKIEYIVVHWVGNANTSALANRNYFNNLKNTHSTSASAHYINGLNGEIIRCIPDDEVAFHAGDSSMNRKSIGIENCHPDWNGKFNNATYNSLIELIAYLCKKYGLGIDRVIRHFDVTGKDCPHYYVKNPNEWNKLKQDVQNKLNSQIDIDILDMDLYNSSYKDLQDTFKGNTASLKNHFLNYGVKEGRIASYVFNPHHYYTKYDDLRKNIGQDCKALYEHFINFGIKEGRQGSKVFDVSYYKKNNSDLKSMDNKEALIHFLNYGIKEFRKTSSEFNVNKYRDKNKDLKESFKNDCKEYFRHYIIYGESEKRKCT